MNNLRFDTFINGGFINSCLDSLNHNWFYDI